MANASEIDKLSVQEVWALIGICPKHAEQVSPVQKPSGKNSPAQESFVQKPSGKNSREQKRWGKKNIPEQESSFQVNALPMAQLAQTPSEVCHYAQTVVAFYYAGKPGDVDVMCGAPFLGNFFQCPVEVNGISHLNAEAAFQGMKYPNEACRAVFPHLTGVQAVLLKLALQKAKFPPDFTYSGMGSNWNAMFAVLEDKYRPGSPMAEALLKTGYAFLLEHTPRCGRDAIWSDNNDGSGTNWLGLQLMCIRERLRDGLVGGPFNGLFSPGDRDGQLGDFAKREYSSWWQAQVLIASTTINDALNSR